MSEEKATISRASLPQDETEDLSEEGSVISSESEEETESVESESGSEYSEEGGGESDDSSVSTESDGLPLEEQLENARDERDRLRDTVRSLIDQIQNYKKNVMIEKEEDRKKLREAQEERLELEMLVEKYESVVGTVEAADQLRRMYEVERKKFETYRGQQMDLMAIMRSEMEKVAEERDRLSKELKEEQQAHSKTIRQLFDLKHKMNNPVEQLDQEVRFKFVFSANKIAEVQVIKDTDEDRVRLSEQNELLMGRLHEMRQEKNIAQEQILQQDEKIKASEERVKSLESEMASQKALIEKLMSEASAKSESPSQTASSTSLPDDKPAMDSPRPAESLVRTLQKDAMKVVHKYLIPGAEMFIGAPSDMVSAVFGNIAGILSDKLSRHVFDGIKMHVLGNMQDGSFQAWILTEEWKKTWTKSAPPALKDVSENKALSQAFCTFAEKAGMLKQALFVLEADVFSRRKVSEGRKKRSSKSSEKKRAASRLVVPSEPIADEEKPKSDKKDSVVVRSVHAALSAVTAAAGSQGTSDHEGGETPRRGRTEEWKRTGVAEPSPRRGAPLIHTGRGRTLSAGNEDENPMAVLASAPVVSEPTFPDFGSPSVGRFSTTESLGRSTMNRMLRRSLQRQMTANDVNIQEGSLRTRLAFEGAVNCLMPVRTNVWVSVGSPSMMHVVDRETFETVRQQQFMFMVKSMILVDNRIWATSNDYVVYVIDPETMNARSLVGHRNNEVLGMAYAGKYVWSCGSDGYICLWDTKSTKVYTRVKIDALMQCIVYVGDSVWVGTSMGIMFFDPENGKQISVAKKKGKDTAAQDAPVEERAMKFSVTTMKVMGKHVWALNSTDGYISIWSTETRRVVRCLPVTRTTSLMSIGNEVWVCSKEIQRFNAETFEKIGMSFRGKHDDTISTITCAKSSEGLRAWTGSEDNQVCVWSTDFRGHEIIESSKNGANCVVCGKSTRGLTVKVLTCRKCEKFVMHKKCLDFFPIGSPCFCVNAPGPQTPTSKAALPPLNRALTTRASQANMLAMSQLSLAKTLEKTPPPQSPVPESEEKKEDK